MIIPLHMPITLVHDNSSIQESRLMTEWLKHHQEITVIDWPTKGYDTNPIEHLWAVMCQDWHVREKQSVATVERTAQHV